MIWRPHQSLTDLKAYIADRIARPPDRARTYALVGRDDSQLRGAFDLRRPEPHRFEFGYVLARTFWGQGLMTEALTEVADWALRQDGVWRISSGTDVENLASARVMEKVGFAKEAILRRWIIHPNISAEPRDWVIYSKIRRHKLNREG